MNTGDIDSIVHLLKTISPWGLLFILIILLPIYIGAWIAIMKLLGLKDQNKTKMIVFIFLVFTLSLVLLKIGVDKDEALKLRAERVKHYLVAYGFRFETFSGLQNACDSSLTVSRCKEIIERFPEDFTITYFTGDSTTEKGIMITNEQTLQKVKQVNLNNLPVARQILNNYIPQDSTVSFADIYNNVDDRLNFDVLEMVTVKYPEEYTAIQGGRKNNLYLKRLK